MGCLKPSPTDQDIFSLIDKSIIYPVCNMCGKQGCPLIDMGEVSKDLFAGALASAD